MTPTRHLHYDAPHPQTKIGHVKRWLRRWWPWIAVVVVAALLVGRTQLQAEELSDTVDNVASLTHENRALTTSLQAAIVDSCVENGNAARKVTRETLHEEIHDAENPDPAVLEAFDNIPQAKLQKLIDENIKTLKKRLNRVHSVNCASQYHISPGSGARRRVKDASN